ncbi:NAD(+)/NADH kinase [Clostridia bacterium]|nr:NAD(+)/NADH kinase [Clostridia bacterium]
MKFAIIANETKENATRLTNETMSWLQARGMEARFLKNDSMIEGNIDSELNAYLQEVDIIIVLGGDGTLLNAGYLFRDYNAPLLGINIGHLGFLTSFEHTNLHEGLEKIASGDYLIEERMTIDVFHERKGKTIGAYTAINDAVVSKNSLARMFTMEISVNDRVIDRYAADGLILSTPTGSTAYSLSAGGPIVEPSLKALLLTPICAHNLYSRPMVVNTEEVISVRVLQSTSDVTLTIDGQIGVEIHDEDIVKVAKGKKNVRFARLEQRNFYQILREKFSKGK